MGKNKKSGKKSKKSGEKKVAAQQSNEDNPNKYLFDYTDFRSVPRWPNDGIEQHRRENEGKPVPRTSDPVQRELTELLGDWPWESPLREISDLESLVLILSLPSTTQNTAAGEEQNFEAAQRYLVGAYKSKEQAVLDLLEAIGCKSVAHKCSRDLTLQRFPPMETFIVPLLRNGLATDRNIELLFGNVSHVRSVLLDMGPLIKSPSPIGSPAHAYLSQFMGAKQKALKPECAECGKKDGKMRRCNDCRSVNYCGRECQVSHWKIHKPECYEVQGKPLSDKILADAKAEKHKRDKIAEQEQERKNIEYQKAVQASLYAFLEEDSGQVAKTLYDCDGKKLRAHLPKHGVHITEYLSQIPSLRLKTEERLSLGIFPDGIDGDTYSFRGILFSDPSNGGARIILLFTNLYESSVEACDCTGSYIDGIFVVDHVSADNRAQWKLVEEPRNLPAHYTRQQFLFGYLEAAKEKAKPVPEDVDLGIHNPGDPQLSMTETEAGAYMKVGWKL